MIYIFTHTDFENIKSNGNEYKILSVKKLHSQYPLDIEYCDSPLEYSLAEGVGIKHLYDKIDTLNNVIGINHYRRYFESDIKKKKVVLPLPLHVDIYEQYSSCHNSNDLLEIESIINKLKPKYNTKSNFLYPCNMFIMDREDFVEYCKFQFSVLDIFGLNHNIKSDLDVVKYVETNKALYTHYNLRYQSRLYGFLMERIGTIFFNNYFDPNDIQHTKIIKTSHKILI